MMPQNTHPYWNVRDLIAQATGVTQVHFSYYKYVPQSILDERHRFQIPRDYFLSGEYIQWLIDSTPSNRELSIHSTVTLAGGEERHIPMADMSTGARAHLPKLEALIEHTGFGEFEWFASGRSFHGYGKRLLEHDEWVKLMGALLLANQRGMPPIVDSRWIGHRLLAGYSALRWTKNTHHYVGSPTALLKF